MTKVSVLVVARNEERFIADCIHSIRSQFRDSSLADWELLLIDGMSTDATVSTAQSILTGANHSWRILENPGRTLATGWNIGINAAKGDYVVRPDAHSELGEDYIIQGVRRLEQMPDVVAVGGTLITKAKTRKGLVFAQALSSKVGVGNSPFRTSSTSGYADTAVFGVYRRQALLDVGGLNESLVRHQDNDLHERLRRKGWRFFQDAGMSATYYCRDSVGALLKQMYAIGFHIPDLWFGKSSGGVELRHLAPLIFVLMVSVLLMAGVAAGQAWISLALPVVYITILLSDSLVNAIRNRIPARLLTFSVIPFMHFAYGIGSAAGLARHYFQRFHP